jgi:hypothetical protein
MAKKNKYGYPKEVWATWNKNERDHFLSVYEYLFFVEGIENGTALVAAGYSAELLRFKREF